MKRRDFMLALAVVPAAGLVPLPSGESPDVFYGVEIRRAGLYIVEVAVSGVLSEQVRLMLDESTIGQMHFAPAPMPHDVVLRAMVNGREGQLVHLDTVDCADVRLEVRRIAGVGDPEQEDA